ncbi:hypothetical protein AABJ39_22685 [Bacteroides fragilis]|uniref:hypothetical protein n=1 Tax=Bacteroides fragilis TaxID=817 RepID=UPI00339CA15A
MAYLETERRFQFSCGVPPLPDRIPFKSYSSAIRDGSEGEADIVAPRVRPALDAGHGGDRGHFGSVYRYQAQLFHCDEQVADFFSSYVPFLREAGFRELQLPGLQLLRPAERIIPAGCQSHP